MSRVEVVPHDPRWRSAFELEAKHVVDFLVEVEDIAEVDGASCSASDY